MNSSVHFNCQACGTVPARYSGIGKPVRRFVIEQGDMINALLEVHPALNCDRTERHKTCKRLLRTVPADYYAGE